MTAARFPAIVMLFLLAACSGGDPPEATGSPSTDPSPASPTAAAVVDPAEQPSIDDAFTVAAGGRQLRLVCWGTGTPTVLLETGGANIEEWTGSGIVHELAPRTRVCTYDRAGTGPVMRRPTSDGTQTTP